MELVIFLLILATSSAIKPKTADIRTICSGPQQTPVDQTINNVIQNAFSAANDMHQTCHEIETLMTNVNNDLLQHFNEETLNIIDFAENITAHIIDTIGAFGEAVADCVQQSDVANITNTFLEDSVQCVAEKLAEGKQILNDLYALGNQSVALAQAVTKNITACGRNIGGVFGPILNPAYLTCKIRVAANASGQFAALAVQKKLKLDEAALYVITLKADLLLCGSLAAANGIAKALEIAADIAICLANSN